MSPPTFLSRHYIAESGAALALVPFAPPVIDAQGALSAHNVVAVGSWSEDAQEHRISIIDVSVQYLGGRARLPTVNRLASLQHVSKATSLCSLEYGNGSVVLCSGGNDGSLSRLRLQLPTLPGSSPEHIDLKGEDLEADTGAIVPCLQPHSAAVTALDANQASKAVLSCSTDGIIASNTVDTVQPSSTALYKSSKGSISFTDIKWASTNSFYTSSLQGCVHAWDARQGGSSNTPTLKLDTEVGKSILRLAVNPAQPFVCAAADSLGAVYIYDSRSTTQKPLTTQLSSGSATKMQFISGDAMRQAQLMFSTSTGVIGFIDTAAGAVRDIYQEHSAAVEDFVFNNTSGSVSQLFALTSQEGIVFAANPC